MSDESPLARGLPEVPGVRHRWVGLRDFEVHVAEAGDADGPCVLLLHGWPQHWYLWRRVIGALRDRARVIAPDLRGFGWSGAPGHGYDPGTFARDQLELLDALGVPSARVIGHDWGGYTTFLLALEAPERVERALVLNAPHPWPRVTPRILAEQWRTWYVFVNSVPLAGRLGFARAILRGGNVGRPFDERQIEMYLERLRRPEQARATALLYRSYLRLLRSAVSGGTAAAGDLEVPTRIVFGSRDRYVSPRLLAGHERHAPDLEIELVPDSGHFIVDEKPALVIERALETLD
jgi:pimeloyl-ACP methyl ester carboxylesterase